jgi:FdhD protein
MTRPAVTSTTRLAKRADGTKAAARFVPEETPIALSYAGTTHAVMMGSPADLHDFALGFSITEGIISSLDEIDEITVEDLGAGIDIQIRLKDTANTRFQARRRRLAGPVGCGLCGIESIDEAMRAVDDVDASGLRLTESDVTSAVKLLSEKQPLHKQTGAVHAAGFYVPGKGIVAAREDVGRHNALDKLAGALASAGIDGTSGAVVVTSRVSVEMVQKTAAIGSPYILAVSAPTALAIRTAEAAGMTLIALVRGEDFDIFSHSDRMKDEGSAMSHDAATNSNAKIIRMANQIGTFFESKTDRAEGVAGIAEHINKFWEPRMRRHFFEAIDAGVEGFRPIVLEAAAHIKRPAPAEKVA